MSVCVSTSGLSTAMSLYVNTHCLEGALHVLAWLCLLLKFRVLCCTWTFSAVCQKENPSERLLESQCGDWSLVVPIADCLMAPKDYPASLFFFHSP